MNPPYEKLGTPRFKVDTSGGQERIEIKPKRHRLLTLFLAFWLCGWTFAGVSVSSTVLAKGIHPFQIVWLGAWAAGWCYAVLMLGWLTTGSETLTSAGGDLQITYRLLGLTIRRLFRGREIHNLSANGAIGSSRGFNIGLPFLKSNKIGSLKFSYGARTVYAGADLDEEEGRRIVSRLLKHLPRGAECS